MGTLKRFFDVTSKGLDKAVKFCKECCDASDAAARFRQQQQQEQQDAQIAQNCLLLEEDRYLAFAEIVKECVSDNAAPCGLRVPKSTAQLYAPQGKRVCYSTQLVCYYYNYVLDRDVRGGERDGRISLRFTDVQEIEMKKILNNKISNFAYVHGFGPVGVLNVEPVSPGVVRVIFAPIGRAFI